MRKLRKSLLNLALGELAAAAVFLFVYVRMLNFGTASLLALLFLVFILVQGSMYWLFRYFVMDRGKVQSIRPVLRVLRAADIVLACFVLGFVILNAQDSIDLIAGLAILAWIRLSYGKSGFNVRLLFQNGWQPSSIYKLLKK